MPEYNKTGTQEENVSFHSVQDGQQEERKKYETFQETPVECSNDSEASGEEHPFADGPGEAPESNIRFSHEKTFTVDPVLNKQTDRVVTFEKDVSEPRRVSTTKHPAL